MMVQSKKMSGQFKTSRDQFAFLTRQWEKMSEDQKEPYRQEAIRLKKELGNEYGEWTNYKNLIRDFMDRVIEQEKKFSASVLSRPAHSRKTRKPMYSKDGKLSQDWINGCKEVLLKYKG